MEFFDEIHKSTLYPEVWGQKTTLCSVKLIQKFWDTFLKIFPLWCWVNFDHPQGSRGVWWGIFQHPRSSQVWEGGHHPSRWHLAPGTCPKTANLAPQEVQNRANWTHFMPFSVNSQPAMGKFSQQGPIRCGQVAIAQAGGTWHLQSPNIGQILFPCALKIKQIWPISCQFSTQKGIYMQPKV